MKKKLLFIITIFIATVAIAAYVTTIDDFFLPGSQIGQSGNLETPDKCDNCHGGFNTAVEPAYNWRGSMMSQAARDPLFFACLAVANQDAPGVGDMCLRCHTPDGWLNGRCVPTDGSALNNNDRQGVQCDFCHKLVKPTDLGTNPFPLDQNYTANIYGSVTYDIDQAYLGILTHIPNTSANGMYIVDNRNAKRGPFTDATGRHQMNYSPFHRDAALCGTCHDVSNPVFVRVQTSDTKYQPNAPGQQSGTFDLRLMYPVERTYSEWMASKFSTPGADFKTCQGCHMPLAPAGSKAASLRDAKPRNDIHVHDMTGGNTFTPKMIKQAFPAEVNAQALDAGMERAKNNLQKAASIKLDVSGSTATVTITNNTGHKLPTGYPEGRRMWINLKAYNSSGNIIFESGAYDATTAELDKTGTKIYECEPAISQEVVDALNPGRPADRQLIAGPSFHMALNNEVHFDNRIPPAGFTNAKLNDFQSPVVGATYIDGQNYDVTSYTLPSGTAKVEAKLYYQTASKEFVDFLKAENYTNTKGNELFALWEANGKSTPELMVSATWDPNAVSNVIDASIQSVLRSTNKQGIAYASAIVLVKSNNLPLAGATVTATYTGPTSGTVSGSTGTDGKVTLKTSTIKTTTGTWCFTVTNVAKAGYTYNGPNPSMCETKSAVTQLEPGQASVNVYPNPYTNRVNFNIYSPDDAKVVIELYDLSGKKVETVCNTIITGGAENTFVFMSNNTTPAVLMYRIQIGSKMHYGKLLNVR